MFQFSDKVRALVNQFLVTILLNQMSKRKIKIEANQSQLKINRNENNQRSNMTMRKKSNTKRQLKSIEENKYIQSLLFCFQFFFNGVECTE